MTTAIVEYSHTEAELAKLRERMSGNVYAVDTPAGMESARKDRRELVTLRTSLEAERKRIKAPALERCQMIDAEAKRITAEIVKLEDPIDALIKAEEERRAEEKRRIEEEKRLRLERIQRSIVDLSAAVVSVAATSAEIASVIRQKRESVADQEKFGEWLPQALAAKAEGIAKLEALLSETQAAEAEAERQRLAREEEDRRRAEEDKRLAEERERLRAEREAFEQQQRAEREKIEAERAEVERQRRQEESARLEREAAERRTREEAERRAREEEHARQAEETRKEIEAAQAAFEARLQKPYDALRAILELAESPTLTDKAARNRMAQAATMALAQEVKP